MRRCNTYTTTYHKKKLEELKRKFEIIDFRHVKVREIKTIIREWYYLSFSIKMNEKELYPQEIKRLAANYNGGDGYDNAIDNVLFGKSGTTIDPAVAMAQVVGSTLEQLLPPVPVLNQDDALRALAARNMLSKQHPEYSVTTFALSRIQQERHFRGLTIEILATVTGLGRATIANLRPENGGVAVRTTTLWLIAHALHVSIDSLLPPS